MPPIRRFLQQPSCVFAYSLGDLADVRRRHAVSGAPTIVDSPIGKAMRFDGSNDYVTLTGMWEERLRFDAGTQDFSVCAWVRRSAVGASHAILSKEDAIDDGWVLRFTSTNAIQIKVNADSAGGPTGVLDFLWHHVAAVVDRSASLYVYLDGSPGSGVAIAGPAMATTTAPTVGARSHDASHKFVGDIHGVEVFDRVLSATEAMDMARGRPF